MLTPALALFPVLLFSSTSLIRAEDDSNFVALATNRFHAGSNATVYLNFDDKKPLTGTVQIQNYETNETIVSSNYVYTPGTPQEVNLQVPADFTGVAKLVVTADNVVKYSSNVTVDHPETYVFVETDRPWYKPGDLIRFRVLLLRNKFKPLTKDISRVWIEAASNERIAQWNNVSTQNGLTQLELQLSKEPVQGTWKIKVQSSKSASISTKEFQVKEYVLPKFEVVITGPDTIRAFSNNVTWKVCGKYSNGKPVHGKAIVRMIIQYKGSSSGYSTSYVYQSLQIKQLNRENECTDVTINQEEWNYHVKKHKVQDADVSAVEVDATVIEAGTDTEENKSKTTVIAAETSELGSDWKLEFVASPTFFKPSLPYYGTVKVTKKNNPVADFNINFKLKAKKVTDPGEYWRNNYEKIDEHNFTTDAQGLIQFTIAPQSVDTHKLFVVLNEDSGYYYHKKTLDLEQSYSRSKRHLLITDNGPVTDAANFKIQYTTDKSESEPNIKFMVESNGEILKDIVAIPPAVFNTFAPTAFEKNRLGNWSTEHNTAVNQFAFAVTGKMYPVSRLLMYYVTNDGEIVADVKEFNVEQKFDIETKFNKAEVLPGAEVTLNIKPNSEESLCAVSGVDKAVTFIPDYDKLTLNKIYEKMKNAYPEGYAYRQDEPCLEENPCDKQCGNNTECTFQGRTGYCRCLPGFVWQRSYCRDKCKGEYGHGPEYCKDCLPSCVDPCPEFCGSGALCKVQGNVASCTCPPGFTGDAFVKCESVEPQVAKLWPTLESHMICNTVDDKKTCTCVPRYKGPNCEFRECNVSMECERHEACVNATCVDPCEGKCEAGVQCKVLDHEAVCLCPDSVVNDKAVKCALYRSNATHPTRHIDSSSGNIVGLSSSLDVFKKVGIKVLSNEDVKYTPCDGKSPDILMCPKCPGSSSIIHKGIDVLECTDLCGPEAECHVSKNNVTSCKCSQGLYGIPPDCRPMCLNSDQCPTGSLCVNRTCINPCPSMCGKNALCEVKGYSVTCNCPKGHTGFANLECAPVGDEVSEIKCEGQNCGPNSLCVAGTKATSCTCLPGYVGNPPECVEGCVEHTDCAWNRACRMSKCENPCEGRCGKNSKCEVRKHTPVCTCLDGFRGDAYTECYPARYPEPVSGPAPSFVDRFATFGSSGASGQSGKVMYEYETLALARPETAAEDVSADGGMAFDYDKSAQIPADEVQGIEIRSLFPETWLWDLVYLGKVEEKSLKLTAPDSITDWVVDAMCLSDSGGVEMAVTTSVKVFKPFFMDFTIPYSVVRGEILPLKVSLFNYMPHPMPITLTFGDFSGGSLKGQRSFSTCLEDRASLIHVFRLNAEHIGTHNITVTAQLDSGNATQCNAPQTLDRISDGIRKPIIVKPEGIPQETTQSKYICLPIGDENNANFDWKLELPNENLVPDSSRTLVSVSGDIMGPSIENLDKLVRFPTGCGEQNMLLFVPNILVLQYLTSSDQGLDSTLEKKLLSHLKTGYQQQLKYKRDDASYSAFGKSDREGSMWLTAFVTKSFAQASKYTFIDKANINASVNWVLSKQRDDGCFPVVGMVHHKEMKGGLSKDGSTSALTAYVLQALLATDLPQLNTTMYNNAVKCMTSNNETTTDLYALALATYTLTLLKDKLPNVTERVEQNMELLKSKAILEGEELRFEMKKDFLALNIEITSYVVLSLVKLGGNERLEMALKAIKWISKHRNSNGGFVSTQDTILALEAISSYETAISQRVTDLKVDLMTSDEFKKQFQISTDYKRVSQQTILPSVPKIVAFKVKGSGCANIQSTLRYNIRNAKVSNAFSLKVSVKPSHGKDCTKLDLNFKTAYLFGTESNMVLMEVQLLSGYKVDEESLDLLKNDVSIPLQKWEMQFGQVNLYFESLTSVPINFEFKIKQDVEVELPQPAEVKLYDYYDPQLMISKTYGLEGIKCAPRQ